MLRDRVDYVVQFLDFVEADNAFLLIVVNADFVRHFGRPFRQDLKLVFVFSDVDREVAQKCSQIDLVSNVESAFVGKDMQIAQHKRSIERLLCSVQNLPQDDPLFEVKWRKYDGVNLFLIAATCFVATPVTIDNPEPAGTIILCRDHKRVDDSAQNVVALADGLLSALIAIRVRVGPRVRWVGVEQSEINRVLADWLYAVGWAAGEGLDV